VKKPKDKALFVILNTKTLHIRLCKTKQRLAEILNLHRNTITNIEFPYNTGDITVFNVIVE